MQSPLNRIKPGPANVSSVNGEVVNSLRFKSLPLFEYSADTAVKVKAGLRKIYNNPKPENKSMTDDLFFIIGDHSIKISVSRVIIKNRLTSKTVIFFTVTENNDLKESLAHALQQLKMMNKGFAQRYKHVFNKPGEVYKFIDELKLKLAHSE